MAVMKTYFGTTQCEKEVSLYTLENANGMKAVLTDYGAILVSLIVPDRQGRPADVVMGYDRLEDYFVNACFFGSLIGPNANRIGKARFSLDGVEYRLAVNDGSNNLHSDEKIGTHKRVWSAETGDCQVIFTLSLKDGEMGFPGNKKLKVTYTLTGDNALRFDYEGTSDKATVLNLTNHSYFNLDGHGAGSIEDHRLLLKASAYTQILPGAIPTGALPPVAGTAMDFNQKTRIGDRIDEDWEQLTMVGGYDHNWCLDAYDGSLRLVGEVSNGSESRTMQLYTDLPGVQFYAGNSISEHTGKAGAVYRRRGALCLETQYYPDSVNQPDFPSCIFGPEREYRSTTIFKFV